MPNKYNCLFLTDLAPSRFWSRTIGAYRLASELRTNGFSAKVINGFSDYDFKELRELLEQFISKETLFLGVSTTFIDSHKRSGSMNGKRNYNSTTLEMILEFTKKTYPHVKIILGGAKTGKQWSDYIDFEIAGFADATIVKIAKQIQENKILELESKSLVADNESFDFASSQTLYGPEDAILPGECLTIEIARGCRFRCKFCGYPMNGRTKPNYYKHIEVLREEMTINYEKYGITNYIFSDDTYNETPEKVKTYMELFESLPFKIQFSCYLRLDLLHRYPETIDMMLRSGLRGAFFGIESLHDKAAASIGKALGRKKVVEALIKVKDSWKQEVTSTASFIVGLPHDTVETITDWVNEIGDPSFPVDHVRLHPLNVHHSGTSKKLWKSEFDLHPEKYGYQISKSNHPDDVPFSGTYWESPTMNSRLALQISQDFLKKYILNPLRYDCFHHSTIMGYGLSHQQVYNLYVNNTEHSEYLNELVLNRVKAYKNLISEHTK